MEIQLSAKEIDAAPAPAAGLARFRPLRVSTVEAPELEPEATDFDHGRASAFSRETITAIREAEPFSLVVCRLFRYATPKIARYLAGELETSRARTGGRYLTAALAFSAPPADFEEIARDLAHLWARAAAVR